MATEYHVAIDGSGDFTTIAQVNAGHSGGDTVLFRRGDTFGYGLSPKSGTSGAPTTFGYYGSGALPILAGNGSAPVISFSNSSYITFQNIAITNNQTQNGIYFSGSNNIIFDTLDISACTAAISGKAWNGNDLDTITVTNCTIHDSSGGSLNTGVYLRSGDDNGGRICLAKNITITNNTINNWYGHGLGVNNTATIQNHQNYNVVITGNNIYSNAQYGIFLVNTDTFYIQNNNVYNNGNGIPSNQYGNGIWVGGSINGLIENNTVYNNATGSSRSDGVGIFLDAVGPNVPSFIGSWGTSNTIVRKNIVYTHFSQHGDLSQKGTGHLGQGNSSGIAMCQGSSYNSIYDNIVYDNCLGIAIWENYAQNSPICDYNLIYHNTITGNQIGIMQETAGTHNEIKNNNIYSNKKVNAIKNENYAFMVNDGTLISDYNLIYDNVNNYYNHTEGAHSILSDPLLNADYTLQAGSPCINAGVKNLGVDTDYNGVKRRGIPDIGAYEYVHVQPRNCLLRNCHLG